MQKLLKDKLVKQKVYLLLLNIIKLHEVEEEEEPIEIWCQWIECQFNKAAWLLLEWWQFKKELLQWKQKPWIWWWFNKVTKWNLKWINVKKDPLIRKKQTIMLKKENKCSKVIRMLKKLRNIAKNIMKRMFQVKI